MPKIPHVIPTRNFEHVRRRVAEILQIELNNQSAIGYDDDLDLTVWEERITPISHAEKRVVNVRLNSDEFDNFFQLNKDGTISIAVDVYATYAGDGSLSMKKLQKILGVIDAILSDSRYKTLGFAKPSLSRVQVTSIEIADQRVQHDATNTCVGRVNFSVRVQETVEPVTPTLLDGYETTVLISDSNSGYLFENPEACLPGTVQIINSANQVIDVVIVASGENDTYNLPDTPVLVTDQNGNPLGNENLPSVTGGTIEVTIAPTPCEPATFEINSIEVATIPAGDTGAIQVLQGGLEVGELSGGNWVVPPCPVVLPCNKLPTKTGQTESFATGDDGDEQRGRETLFFTLTNNSFVGHNFRFVGKTGGYYDGTNFRDIDGNIVTKAEAFPDDVCVDWAYFNGDASTGIIMMWHINTVTLVQQPGNKQPTWVNYLQHQYGDTTVVDVVVPQAAYGGYTGWKVPNLNEMLPIHQRVTGGTLQGYEPFNETSSSTRFILNETDILLTDNFVEARNNSILLIGSPKTLGLQTFKVVRYLRYATYTIDPVTGVVTYN